MTDADLLEQWATQGKPATPQSLITPADQAAVYKASANTGDRLRILQDERKNAVAQGDSAGTAALDREIARTQGSTAPSDADLLEQWASGQPSAQSGSTGQQTSPGDAFTSGVRAARGAEPFEAAPGFLDKLAAHSRDLRAGSAPVNAVLGAPGQLATDAITGTAKQIAGLATGGWAYARDLLGGKGDYSDVASARQSGQQATGDVTPDALANRNPVATAVEAPMAAVGNWIGRGVESASDWLSSNVSPAVGAAVPLAMDALGVAGLKGAGARYAAGTEQAARAANAGRAAWDAAPAARVEPAGGAAFGGAGPGLEVPPAGSGAAGQAGNAGATGATPFKAGSVGAAQVADIPPSAYLPSEVPQGAFPTWKKQTVGEDLHPEDQTARADVLKAIGVDEAGHGFREGALTGNPKTQASEVMTAKTDTPQGAVYQQQLAAEQQALRNYGARLQQMAGGTAQTGGIAQEVLDFQRGENIVKPLKLLEQHFNDQAKNLYTQADQAAAGMPINTYSLSGLLMDPGFRAKLVATGNKGLLDGVESMMDRFQKEGWGNGIGPSTVKAAENFRQWLNDASTPETGRYIAQVKQALDTDVAQAGGGQLYTQARALWKQYKDTLDNPKGISSIMAESGPDGINRQIPLNVVAQKLVTMKDSAQFKHVVGVLQKMSQGADDFGGIGPEAQQAAQQALHEVRQQLADNAVNAGGKTQAWNPDNYNKTVSTNADRMASVFNPEEMKAFRTLNDGGYILDMNHAYPGAAVQGINAMKSFAINQTGKAGAVAGSALFGPAGAAAGAIAGEKMGSFLQGRAAMAQAEAIRRKMQQNVQKHQE
jgi:hypothetical protein